MTIRPQVLQGLNRRRGRQDWRESMRSKSAAPKYQRSYNAHWEYDPQEDHSEPHHAPQMTPEAPPPKALHVHVSEVWRECMESIQLEYHAYCNRVAKRLRDEARHRREAEEDRSYNMPPIMRGCIRVDRRVLSAMVCTEGRGLQSCRGSYAHPAVFGSLI
jgi:hypothetical protein